MPISHNIFLSEEKQAERRPALERITESLKKNRRQRLARQCVPDWSDQEKALVVPYAEKVKNKAMSYYRACNELEPLLPGRTFEAIRKKLKNWVNDGKFR
jgi:hypothetical protein